MGGKNMEKTELDPLALGYSTAILGFERWALYRS
jgi:hypothetical protein